MRDISERLNKSMVNESMVNWTICGEINHTFGPGGSETTAPADKDAEYMSIYPDGPCIEFLSDNDIEEIDEANDCNGKLYRKVTKLKYGESYVDPDGDGTFYVRIKK